LTKPKGKKKLFIDYRIIYPYPNASHGACK